MAQGWTSADIPSLSGKVAVVTGSTDGLGREVATRLAEKGATVLLAGRSAERGQAAVAAIGSNATFERLDLANLTSVRAFAATTTKRFGRIDMLINNAGVAMIPARQVTEDGFESQIAINHLGHFALTAALLPALIAGGEARVVTVSSLAHIHARMDLDDLSAETRYSPGAAYGRSKLATLLFAMELDRRAKAGGWPLRAVAAHPGVAESNLQVAGPNVGVKDGKVSLVTRLGVAVTRMIGQSTVRGALPLLRAATDPAVVGGEYFGPDGWAGLKGAPTAVSPAPHGRDAEVAARLWSVSEGLTGARWPVSNPPS